MIHAKLAFLGGGNMGRALISGLLRRGTRPERICVSDPLAQARDTLVRDLGITATADNAAAVADADLIVLAVKPQNAADVLTPLRPLLQQRHPLLLSIAAGVRIAALTRWCGPAVPVARAMPNRPALVGAGITGLYAPDGLDVQARAAAEQVMSAVGEVVWVGDEDAIDTVTALSGSGPAYFFLVAEILAQAATDLGLPPDTARRLAVATLHGAGAQAHLSDGDLERLRLEVTSRGGTTEAALRTLKERDLAGTLTAALRAAAARARELGEQLGA
jgi:pyrroline-5-carboxylate reductase